MMDTTSRHMPITISAIMEAAITIQDGIFDPTIMFDNFWGNCNWVNTVPRIIAPTMIIRIMAPPLVLSAITRYICLGFSTPVTRQTMMA